MTAPSAVSGIGTPQPVSVLARPAIRHHAKTLCKMPQYGSKTRHDHHRRITEIVAKYARQSRPVSFAAWPLRGHLAEICAALDELQIPIPRNWKEGRTESLRRLGLHLNGWSDALALGYERLVVWQIRYSIGREHLIDAVEAFSTVSIRASS
jgi:hypothetical protein